MADGEPPVTFGIKVTKDLGHVHFDVFAGTTPDARGRAGSLVMRPDEFHEFLRRLNPERLQEELRCCERPNLVWEHTRDGREFFRCHGCRGGMSRPVGAGPLGGDGWEVRDGG